MMVFHKENSALHWLFLSEAGVQFKILLANGSNCWVLGCFLEVTSCFDYVPKPGNMQSVYADFRSARSPYMTGQAF
jgi:hypothetical protein